MWEVALLDLLKYTIPALVVFGVVYWVIQAFFKREENLKKLQIRMDNRKELLPMRLQAYERMSLFLERIGISSLIQRLRRADMPATELRLQMIQTIRAEYEHNLSMQIYISSETWQAVSLCKDEMIKMINIIGTSLPEDATATAFSHALLDAVLKSGDMMPTQRAMEVLKTEAQSIF